MNLSSEFPMFYPKIDGKNHQSSLILMHSKDETQYKQIINRFDPILYNRFDQIQYVTYSTVNNN